MRQRTLYLLKTYVLTVLLFVAAKPVFMLYNRADHPFSMGDVGSVIAHGLSLDLSMSLYLLAVPFLCAVASIFVGGARWLRILLRVYYVIIAFALSLTFIADTSLYEFWLFKLDASCLQYLETPTEAMASVSLGYLLLRLVLLVVLTLAIWAAYTRPRWYVQTSRHRIVESVVALLLIPLIVIGIRGGIGESTTNIGQVYFSQNQFLNHSAVNPLFSFFASLEKSASNSVSYHFMNDAKCRQIIEQLYPTESIDSDTLLTTRTPDIVVILLESCGSVFTAQGGRPDVMPHLNQLAREGISFQNCYGNTWRTDRGTVCTWSGYPSFPTMSVMKMPSKSRSLPNIARTLLQERGYATYYLYGGDINFTNMRSYLVSGGFQHLRWKDDYSAQEQRTAQWGVRDDITFQTLGDMIEQAHSPFLIGYSTLSTHEPWDVPIHQFDDEKLNAFHYLDQCIGRFVSRLRKTKAWQNTLMILLPDHGIPYNGLTELHPLKNQIPMIWVGGAVRGPRRIEKICNQTDLPATLLGQLGLPHDDFTFSRDVLSRSYTTPFAVNTYDDGFSIYDTSGFLNFDFISNKVVATQGQPDSSLVARGKAILQAASKDLEER